MSINSTDYTKPSINSENYGKTIVTSDVLLLEGGDKLLLENGTDAILLSLLVDNSINLAKITINSTSFSKP